MVSSSGGAQTQSLDPLHPIIVQQTKPMNLTNSVHYNEILKSVIQGNEDRGGAIQCGQFHPTHPFSINNATAIENFLARSEHVEGNGPFDRRWVQYNPNYYHRQIGEGSMVVVGHEKRLTCSEDLREKSIERKQKRMIKNRESAARSRARKQAHTKQLEQEVLRLQEMNNWLRSKLDMEKRILSSESMPQKIQLRRTNSATF